MIHFGIVFEIPDWSVWLVVYVVMVLAFGAWALFRVLNVLQRVRSARLRRLASRRRFDAIPTSGPMDDPSGVAKKRAQESIERQFTVNRRVLVPMVVLGTVVMLGLPFLGSVPAAFVTLIAASTTVFLGVATRPIVENAIAGLVISSSRLINIGDTVKVDDIYGTIEDISTTHTTIKVWDWRRYVVPNTRMLQTSFLNYSISDRYLWASVDFFVAPGTDVQRAQALAIEAAEQSRYFAAHEPPECWVMELRPETVRLRVAAWANTPSDAWMLTDEVRRVLTQRLRAEGIETHATTHRFAEGAPASSWAARVPTVPSDNPGPVDDPDRPRPEGPGSVGGPGPAAPVPDRPPAPRSVSAL
ncbi:MAG TPA: mechanosensitive ion channel family protein [Myxococcales bacterium LLY-WYZ-16_1]|nr:mechanosensitive ion channel family protein [Myxococcales bacterium LLY-WYZ-16_1]